MSAAAVISVPHVAAAVQQESLLFHDGPERNTGVEPGGHFPIVESQDGTPDFDGFTPAKANRPLNFEAHIGGNRVAQGEPDSPFAQIYDLERVPLHQQLGPQGVRVGDPVILAVVNPAHAFSTRASRCGAASPAPSAWLPPES